MIFKKYDYKNFPAILIVIVISALAFYVYLFLLVKNENVKASEFEQSIKNATNRDERSLSERSILRGTENERKELEKYFLYQGNEVAFIEKIESLGDISGSRVSFTSVDSEKEIFKANLSATGGFKEIYHLLSLLETMPFQISVKRLSLGKLATIGILQGKNQGEWSGEFSIELLNFIETKPTQRSALRPPLARSVGE